MGPNHADNGPDSNKGSLVVKFIKYISLTTISAFLLSGCATIGAYNPATGRKEFIVVSTVSEVNMGENVHKELIQKYIDAKQLRMFRFLRQEVEIGANGTQKYLIKHGKNKGKIL